MAARDKGRFHVVAQLEEHVPQPLEVAEVGRREQRARSGPPLREILAQATDAEEDVLAEALRPARNSPRVE